MRMKTIFLGFALFSLSAAGCQGEAGALAGNGAGGDAPPGAAAPEAARAPTGTIEIDGQAWTVVPEMQCAIHPGPMVFIAGHAAEDSAILIAIEFNPGDNVVETQVGANDASIVWVAAEDGLTINVTGQRVTGEGSFVWSGPGEPRTAQGSFDIQCR